VPLRKTACLPVFLTVVHRPNLLVGTSTCPAYPPHPSHVVTMRIQPLHAPCHLSWARPPPRHTTSLHAPLSLKPTPFIRPACPACCQNPPCGEESSTRPRVFSRSPIQTCPLHPFINHTLACLSFGQPARLAPRHASLLSTKASYSHRARPLCLPSLMSSLTLPPHRSVSFCLRQSPPPPFVKSLQAQSPPYVCPFILTLPNSIGPSAAHSCSSPFVGSRAPLSITVTFCVFVPCLCKPSSRLRLCILCPAGLPFPATAMLSKFSNAQ